MTPGEQFHEPCAATMWRHGTIPVVGLTGGVASGKSAVGALLGQHGFATIDADKVGHAALEDPDVRQKVVERFGNGVMFEHDQLATEPKVDRRALGAIVFKDREARRALEAIVHPIMRAQFARAIDRELETTRRPVVLDAAVLYEAGWDDLCDLVVFVDSPRPVRLGRAKNQRGWSEAVFDAREQAQWSCEEKRRRADFIIRNDAGADLLGGEVLALVAFLRTLEDRAAANSGARTIDRASALKAPPDRSRPHGTGSGAWQVSSLVL
jgi:dephospho-CoA kinase